MPLAKITFPLADEIQEKFNQREISRKEKYNQYLNDNNLEDVYVPTQGNPCNTFFLVSVFFSQVTVRI